MKKQTRADFLLVMVTFFWGSSYYLTDLCLREMPPMFLNAFRFLSAFVMLAVLFFPRLRQASKRTFLWALRVGLALTGTYVFYGFGIGRTSISNAGFICGLAVLFTPVLDFLCYRIKPERKMCSCMLLCILGLALLTLDEHLHIASGDLICLGVPICYAVDLLLTEKAVGEADVDALAMGIYELLVVGVLTLLMSFVLEEPRFPVTAKVWAAALFLGVFCSGIAFVIQSVQQKYTSAVHVGLIFTLEPLFAAVVAFFLAGEVLSPRGYLGMGLMFLSLVFMELGSETTAA